MPKWPRHCKGRGALERITRTLANNQQNKYNSANVTAAKGHQMSQVIVEFGQVAPSAVNRQTPVSHYQAVTEEITSSGTSQATTATTDATAGLRNDAMVTVINNGTDAIWVAFGATATAASPARFIAPNTTRDFGGLSAGVTVSVINDT